MLNSNQGKVAENVRMKGIRQLGGMFVILRVEEKLNQQRMLSLVVLMAVLFVF